MACQDPDAVNLTEAPAVECARTTVDCSLRSVLRESADSTWDRSTRVPLVLQLGTQLSPQ